MGEIGVEREHHDPALRFSEADDLVGQHDPVNELIRLAPVIRLRALAGRLQLRGEQPVRLALPRAERVDDLFPGNAHEPAGQGAAAGVEGVLAAPGGDEDLLGDVLRVAG